jgi:acetyltransferase-like isoleucine patch superfamily enzyme
MGFSCLDIISCQGGIMDSETLAKGNFYRRIFSAIFLLPAWFAPHSVLRVFFHRLRGVKIGKNVEIGYFCIMGNVNPRMITIEDSTTIAAGAALLEHDNSYYYSHRGAVKSGPILIKMNSFIGINAVVMPNVTIGPRSIVAANSVVTRNIGPDSVVGGVPAIKIKTLPS